MEAKGEGVRNVLSRDLGPRFKSVKNVGNVTFASAFATNWQKAKLLKRVKCYTYMHKF